MAFNGTSEYLHIILVTLPIFAREKYKEKNYLRRNKPKNQAKKEPINVFCTKLISTMFTMSIGKNKVRHLVL